MASVGRWDLPDDATAARVARQHLRVVAAGWPEGALDVVLLLATELVTNAVRHGAGPVHLEVDRIGTDLRVSVYDTGSQAPTTRKAFPDANVEGGRGVPLLEALAERWGTEPDPQAPGKKTWFTVRTGA